MNYILFDDKQVRTNLLPLTFTRPECDLRYGITTIREKWEKGLGAKTSTLASKYLSKKFPTVEDNINILIKGNIIPNKKLINAVQSLKPNESLVKGNLVLAYNISKELLSDEKTEMEEGNIEFDGEVHCVKHTWQLFSELDEAIKADYKAITQGRKSASISKTNNLINPKDIFVEEGANVEYATLNATDGPIYIAKDAVVMEGSFIRGPFSLGEHSQIKAGAKIYGATSIGPHCKVGGEVSNSIFLGYANKAHDGFIGNSVIGEWCNLGAGTNCSNLKNTYDPVRLWNYTSESFESTGLQFCGVIMGDHSKIGINSMLNTGTVIGVNVNLFGSGFPRNIISSFSWGGASGFKEYNLNKSFQVAERVYARRGMEFDQIEKDIMKHIYEDVVR